MKKIIDIIALLMLCKFSLGTTYTVTNTNDNGAGSLRTAVTSALANSAGAPHLIKFNIPTTDAGYDQATGVWTIVFLDEGLPAFSSGNITIDGTSQTTFAGNTNPNGPEVCLNGNQNNVEFCISIQNSPNITIKGLIINEFLYGIQVYGVNAKYNKFVGNYLGCNYDGTQRKGNYNAIEIISGANYNQVGGRLPEERNLVSGNEYAGIRISDAHHNLVINNFVGVNRTGTEELHNYDGITVEGAGAYNQIGGDSVCERNVTSGNVAYGVDIFGVGCIGNVVQGNFIGTDATGSYAIPNTYGLLFDDRSHQNMVGGYNPGEGNLISGNTAFGAYFYNNGTNSNSLIGNKIGTNFAGTAAIPNETGVHIDGCTYANFVDSNLIAGNRANGITVFATFSDYNTIIRNKIGTDITGTLPLGNGMHGILITQGAANNTIGGTPQNANIIAYNGRNGVTIQSENCDHNLVSCNSIHSNGNFGIELYPNDGFNENDPGDIDTGPNDLLNSPVISNLTFNGAQATLSGTIDVASPSTTKIELYRAQQNQIYCSEGIDYLGSTYCNSLGQWSFTFTYTNSLHYYSALSIDAENNTSEFSREFPLQPIQVSANAPIAENTEVKIFPNPCQKGNTITIETENNSFDKCLVYNVIGELIMNFTFDSNRKLEIPSSSLENGIYFIKLASNSNNHISTKKIIVSK
ncbi:MAG: T9SS type A sorting domain-containing protein [Bacteroidota bacterium]